MVPRHLIVPIALVAAGCASYSGSGLRAGEATEEQVVATMGRPAMTLPNEDGGRRLVYPRGPLGTQTYMADVGREGRLVAISQALGDGVFNAIQPGMSREEVLHLIGPPGQGMRFPLSDRYAWDWRYVDTWGYTAIFSVTFDAQDRVVSKITQRIERSDRAR